MISRGLTAQSISDAYPFPPTHRYTCLLPSTLRLAATSANVPPNKRSDYQPCFALPPRVYGAPWITDGCESSFQLSRWDHFLSAGCHSFCVRYSCRLYFCAAILKVHCQLSMVSNAFATSFHSTVLRHCENERLH